MKLSKKTEKGITLIALIITIIIMIILVVVTVSIALNVGLFKKAGDAVANTDLAMQREKNLTGGSVRIGDTTYNSIDEYLATIGGGGETPEGDDPNVVYEVPETYTYAINVGGLNMDSEYYIPDDEEFSPYYRDMAGDNVKMYIVPINAGQQDVYVVGTGPMSESRNCWYYTTTSEIYEDEEWHPLYKNTYYDMDEDGEYLSWVTSLLKGTRNVYISYGVTSISCKFMKSVYDLGTVYIPSSVISIEESAFYNTKGLDYINIPYGVTTIENDAFWSSGIKSITIPETVTSIGSNAFTCSEITSITIPGTVTLIGSCAFTESDLTNVVFSDGITNIGGSVFKDCYFLESVTIPESVTHIDESAFAGCWRLTTVNYKGTEEEWNNITIESDNDCLLYSTINYNYTGE